MKKLILASLVAAVACCAQNGGVTNNNHFVYRQNSALSFPTVEFQEGYFKVAFELVTNWVTLHEEPLTKTNTNGPTLCRQAGQVFSNNIALILWNGATNRVSLDSAPLDLAVLPQRTITNEPAIITTNFVVPPSWKYYVYPQNTTTPL